MAGTTLRRRGIITLLQDCQTSPARPYDCVAIKWSWKGQHDDRKSSLTPRRLIKNEEHNLEIHVHNFKARGGGVHNHKHTSGGLGDKLAVANCVCGYDWAFALGQRKITKTCVAINGRMLTDF